MKEDISKDEMSEKFVSGKMTQQELEDFYLKKFLSMRDDWSDDLPDVDVRSLTRLDENGEFVGDKYKCRRNYIIALSLRIEGAIEKSIIKDQQIISKFEDFRQHNFRFYHGEFTTKEEIDMINDILQNIICHLQEKEINNTVSLFLL